MWIHNHAGSFEIWNGRQAWFWFVADPCWSGAAIGAAANQTEAIYEACSLIEEMAARRSSSSAASGITKAISRTTRKCNPASSTDPGSNDLLANQDTRLSS